MVAPPAFDPRAFRDALGRFATGVAVVLARCPDGRMAGMTINSFASVSLTPPLVLWSMKTDTASAQVYRDARAFTVSVLSVEQEEVARRFARSHAEKLDGDWFIEAPSGLPRLEGATGWFDCLAWATHPAGDHEVHIGEVRAFGHNPGPTLVFHDGRFAASNG